MLVQLLHLEELGLLVTDHLEKPVLNDENSLVSEANNPTIQNRPAKTYHLCFLFLL